MVQIDRILKFVCGVSFAIACALITLADVRALLAVKVLSCVCLAAAAGWMFWWGVTGRSSKRLKLILGLPSVVILSAVLLLIIELLNAREQYIPSQVSGLDIGALSNKEIKTRTVALVASIRDFEAVNQDEITEDIIQQPPTMASTQQREEFLGKKSARIISEGARANGVWRAYYLPEALAILSAAKERVVGGLPSPPMEATPALDGLLAGVRPASAAADYLTSVVAKLPED